MNAISALFNHVQCCVSLIFWVLISSCSNDDDSSNGLKDFAVCNDLLVDACLQPSSDYCLFGHKWGQEPSFSPAGAQVTGPQISGGTVTFSFQEANGTLNTHREVQVPSLSFSTLQEFAKEEIRLAFVAWAGVADIDFVEEADNSESDIRLYVANIVQTGVAFPNFQGGTCASLSGQFVINPSAGFQDRESFRRLVLHEIGHTLGLGHVASGNIMATNVSVADGFAPVIQSGDSLGIIQIYGKDE